MAEALTPGETTLTWSDRSVNTQAIDEALDRLRQEAAGSDTEATSFAMRTSVLNLVAFAADAEAARRVSDTISSLPSHHPSRAIVIVAAPSEEEPCIDAELSAHCHLTDGPSQQTASTARQVCCEQVTLSVRGRAAHHLHSLVVPLLVPDLPVHLWWTTDLPKDTHLLDQLVDACDRLIVDSARFRTPVTLDRLVQLSRSQYRACAVGDLTWARLAPWRQLIAQFFDASTLRPHLDRLDQVTIQLAAPNASMLNSAQGLLIIGWLTSRLGWELSRRLPARGSSQRFQMRHDEADITISLRVRPSPRAEGGGLLGVRLSAATPDGRVTFAVARERNPRCLSATVVGPDVHLARTASIEAGTDAELLSQQLQALGRDRVFEEALTVAAQLTRR